MTRRSFLLTPALLPVLRAQQRRRPNILLILADDLGWGDVSMNRCPDIQTPNIDGIAASGVRFSQYYANAPECTPTRCALLTGRYQHRVGGLECAIGVNNIGRYDEAEWLQKRGELGLPATEITMARIFRDAGYDTGMFGKWHLGYEPKHWPDKHGFTDSFGVLGGSADYFLHTEMNEGEGKQHLYENGKPVDPKGYMTDIIADKALAWLKGRSASKPWLLYLPFTAPHVPIQDPDDFDPKTGTAPYKQKDRKAFGAMVRRLDQRIGSVLKQLDAMGAASNTLVVFISDNGGDPNGRNLPYRGQKSQVFEGGIRVPAAARWTGVIPAGRTAGQVALSMDWLPTFLEASGVPAPSGRKLDGMSLMPVLTGKGSAPSSRTVFWRYKRAENRRKAVRDGDWKYINDSGKEYLFHLGRDERETEDVLTKEPHVASKLRAKLAAWEEDVRAPRLRDFVPAPKREKKG